jgi:hypothetical protein
MKITCEDGTEIQLPPLPTVTANEDGWFRVEGDEGYYNPQGDVSTLLDEIAFNLSLIKARQTGQVMLTHGANCQDGRWFDTSNYHGRYQCHGECINTTITVADENKHELRKVRRVLADPTARDRDEWVKIEADIVVQLQAQSVPVSPYEPTESSVWTRLKWKQSKNYRELLHLRAESSL